MMLLDQMSNISAEFIMITSLQTMHHANIKGGYLTVDIMDRVGNHYIATVHVASWGLLQVIFFAWHSLKQEALIFAPSPGWVTGMSMINSYHTSNNNPFFLGRGVRQALENVCPNLIHLVLLEATMKGWTGEKMYSSLLEVRVKWNRYKKDIFFIQNVYINTNISNNFIALLMQSNHKIGILTFIQYSTKDTY